MQHQEIGRRGEALAADFLSHQGFVILARNLRLKSDEIDILARKGDTVHLIEVKTSERQSTAFPAEIRLDWHKRRALARSAQQISARYPGYNIQVGAVTVYLQQPPLITYLPTILD